MTERLEAPNPYEPPDAETRDTGVNSRSVKEPSPLLRQLQIALWVELIGLVLCATGFLLPLVVGIAARRNSSMMTAFNNMGTAFALTSLAACLAANGYLFFGSAYCLANEGNGLTYLIASIILPMICVLIMLLG